MHRLVSVDEELCEVASDHLNLGRIVLALLVEEFDTVDGACLFVGDAELFCVLWVGRFQDHDEQLKIQVGTLYRINQLDRVVQVFLLYESDSFTTC